MKLRLKKSQNLPSSRKMILLKRFILGCGFFLLLCFSTGCAVPMIEGTKLTATDDNKAIYMIVQRYKNAMLAGKGEGILKLVSTRFHETRGTPTPKDDYGYEELKKFLLSKSFKRVRVLRFEVKVKRINIFSKNQAHIFMKVWHSHRYPVGDYRPGLDAGPAEYRILMSKSSGRWMIMSGL